MHRDPQNAAMIFYGCFAGLKILRSIEMPSSQSRYLLRWSCRELDYSRPLRCRRRLRCDNYKMVLTQPYRPCRRLKLWSIRRPELHSSAMI